MYYIFEYIFAAYKKKNEILVQILKYLSQNQGTVVHNFFFTIKYVWYVAALDWCSVTVEIINPNHSKCLHGENTE